ncbi:MAG: hypothetical protein ABFQ95_02935 [Pseudomonadota bacterium]
MGFSIRFWLCFGFCLLSMGCSKLQRYDYHDPSLRLDSEKYEEILTGKVAEEYAPVSLASSVYKPVRIDPELPVCMTRPVSLAITEMVPIKDVIFEMARQAKVNVMVDPCVKGGVYLNAHQKPFINLIQEICAMTNLRYHIDAGVLSITLDTPYLKTYELGFLSLSRQNQNRISMATDVFTAMEGYSRDFDNGSSALIKGESTMDFWAELEANLKVILHASGDKNPRYTIHKQAGLLSAFTTQKQHIQLEAYLNRVEQNTQLQVLIEAKIVEVNLDEEYQGGINWHRVKSDFKLIAPLGSLSIPGAFEEMKHRERNIFTIGSGGQTLTALARVLNRFGTVRTLSSPRMTVMNNQSAVLKVATNLVFFKINYSRELRENEKNDIERASSQIQTVPIGLVMIVHPTFHPKTGRVTLSLRPTISRVINEKEDPAVGILSQETKTSLIPEVQVRELDTVLQTNSGDVVIMGGLMEERADNEKVGPAGLQDIPVLGHLFSGKTNKRSVNELVIFLRATILDPIASNVTAADRRVYKAFAQDPRSLNFQ